MDLSKLKEPFPDNKIHWRVGATTKDKSKGIALAYIDARDLYERLDEVCGAENWQIRYPHANSKTTCEIGIRINGEWVWKANGAGDTQVEQEKGAYSDAAKRAGVPWGIAAYLYDMPNEWVELDQFRKIKKEELPKLNATHDKLARVEWLRIAAKQIDGFNSTAELVNWETRSQERIQGLADNQRNALEGKINKRHEELKKAA